MHKNFGEAVKRDSVDSYETPVIAIAIVIKRADFRICDYIFEKILSVCHLNVLCRQWCMNIGFSSALQLYSWKQKIINIYV